MGRDPPGEDDRLETNLNTVVPWRVLELDLLRNEPGCRQGDRRRLLGPDKRRVPIVGLVHDRTVHLDGGVENTQVVARQRHDLDRRRTDFGWTKPGVCGSGIPSLTRTALWKTLGPWKTRGGRTEIGLVDSSLGAEEDMIQRFYASRMAIQGAIPLVPVAADIITDPLGCKAKVRGSYRYGVYMPPPDGTYYYRIREYDRYRGYRGDFPMDFSEGVLPLGFDMPVDARGDRLKHPLNTSVKFDILQDRPVPHPLAHGEERTGTDRPDPSSTA